MQSPAETQHTAAGRPCSNPAADVAVGSSMKGWKVDDVWQREANLTFTAGVCLRSGPACQPTRSCRAAGGGRQRLPPHWCGRAAPATPGTAPAPCASQGRGAAPDGVSNGRPAERQLLTDKTAAARRTGRTDAAGRQQGAQAACANPGGGGGGARAFPNQSALGAGTSSTIGFAKLNWPVCHRPVITWPFNVTCKLECTLIPVPRIEFA